MVDSALERVAPTTFGTVTVSPPLLPKDTTIETDEPLVTVSPLLGD
jgi:hypothetical protein